MSNPFAVRLHGPGLPDAGLATSARFAGEHLQVADGGHAVAAHRLAVDAGGFNQDDLVLSWSDGAASFALLVSAAEAKETLLASAPAVLSRRLRRWSRSVGFTRHFWRTAAMLGALTGIAIVLGLWQHERVVAWTAAQIPLESERRLGQAAMAGIRADGHLVETSAALDAIRDIGGRLTAGSARTYEWHLSDDPGVNAFAIPGGFIVVHAGLVNRVESPEELAGVLAHEIQHIEQRHTLQGLLYQLGWATLLTVALGDPSTLTTLLLLEMGNLKFNRDLEARADAGAVTALRQAGIDPVGLAGFFRKLAGETPDAGMLEWLSTHPDTANRIAAVEAAATAQACGACKPLPHDWPAIRASLQKEGLIRTTAAATR